MDIQSIYIVFTQEDRDCQPGSCNFNHEGHEDHEKEKNGTGWD
jgi:hypothetical protein